MGSPWTICSPYVKVLINGLFSYWIFFKNTTNFDTGVFPDSLKKAQVTPLHKKNDPLSKTNYRPVSVLPFFFLKFLKRYLKHNYLIFSTQYLTLFVCFPTWTWMPDHVAQTSRRLALSPRQKLLYSISSDGPFKGF